MTLREDAVVDELLDRVRAERTTFERVLLRLPDVMAGLDEQRIRSGIVELTLELCRGEFAFLVTDDEDENTATWAGLDLEERPAVWRAPLLSGSFREAPVLRIDDVGRWARTERAAALYGTLPGGAMVRSYVIAPVTDREGEVVAALYVGHHRAHAFAAHHERLIEAMARFLATALDNARRYRERADVANALEETLLPPLLPTVRGVDFGVRYRAAHGGSVVGGDFYDVYRSGDGWAAVIGDVCGTGPEAAAVTGIARYTVRALAGTGITPAEKMLALNETLVQNADRRFLTAIHLRFREPVEAGAGVHIVFARAGHPPPVLLRAEGEAILLEEPKGCLLGVFADAKVEDGWLDLEPGDALVLYTDGVVEARRPDGEQYGYDRLCELVSTCAGRTADGVARRIELAVTDFVGGDIDDDVAILVLRAV